MADSQFPSLKDLLNSYPVARAKAAVKDLGSNADAAQNEYLIKMHEQNKMINELAGKPSIGGLEQVTPETSKEDAARIAEAKMQLDTLGNIPDSISVVGGVGSGGKSIAELLRDQPNRGFGNIISKPINKDIGKVIQVSEDGNTAKKLSDYQKIKDALTKMRTPF